MTRATIRASVMCTVSLIVLGPLSCGNRPAGPATDGFASGTTESNESESTSPTTESRTSSGLIQPQDLTYLGAFRLPEGSNGTSWDYGGNALTYYPGGDPRGPADGFHGSLFGTGHDWEQQVSEVSIPIPVISANKNLDELSAATTLQGFRDIRASLRIEALELPRAGLEYLPRQGAQTTDKLHFCWGQHYQENRVVSHGWCELSLSDTKTAGGWYIGQQSNYSIDDYLFAIPPAWAAANTPGKMLATGRFRDGGWSGQGPSLFAYGPWNQGNPPPANTHLHEVTLLLYTSTLNFDGAQHTMNGYHHSDEWSGGAWLTTGDKSAVVFVGTKGTGACWYGFANGVRWPDAPPYPPIPAPPNNDRGWWSTGFKGQFIFYDPDDLAAVARGTMQPHEPQPYASLDVDDRLYRVRSAQQKQHLGDVAFDRINGLLYVLEYRADGDKPLVHTWRVGT